MTTRLNQTDVDRVHRLARQGTARKSIAQRLNVSCGCIDYVLSDRPPSWIETDGQRCSWCEEPLTPRRTIHLHRYQFCPTCHKRVFREVDAAKQLFKGIF